MSKFVLKKREEIRKEFQWDLESIFATIEAWKTEFSEVSDKMKSLSQYRGRLMESSKTLLSAIEEMLSIEERLERLQVYASHRHDENTANPEYQELKEKILSLYTKYGTLIAYMEPEILAADTALVYEYIESDNGLKPYRQYLDDILRKKEHTLSNEEEEVLSQISDINRNASKIYTMFLNADMKHPTIKDENGQDVQLTAGNFIPMLESSDRRVRKDAFEAYYSTYRSFKNTLATAFAGEVKKNVTIASVRKFSSAREASLFRNNIPEAVYDRLIDSVHANMDKMYRYMSLRKKLLGLDEMHMYDLATPMIAGVKKSVPYEEAVETILAALQPMGEEYVSILKRGFEERWVDRYENEGKRSGAYSGGAYGTKPFVLMNYHDDLDGMFTLAHEMGHSMHSYFARRNQPYAYSGYSIFLAEVASTCNETLLMNYLLEKEQDIPTKKYLLNKYLDTFKSTLYRQTMFAEFEHIMHRQVENGGALTADFLCDEYEKLTRLYFGDEVVIDPEIAYEWSRVPHFFYNFYVFQYATGISAATAFAKKILTEGTPAVEKYMGFLKSGSSAYSIETLQRAGVDMLTSDPVDSALSLFGETMDQLEKLL